jgi:RNA-directed DNA polymerase
MPETPSSKNISPKLERIARMAKQASGMSFTTLSQHIDIDWLREAHRRTRKDGATGVDAQTAAEYATNLEGNLKSLLDRAKSGTYRAPPVLRVHIPKGDGSQTRPIGIPTFEDKVLQRAVAMVLEAIYEQDFLDCSYGFRPRRSAHDALNAQRNQLMSMRGAWVLEVDIEKYFDTIDHAQLSELLRRRVRDGVLLRLIGKWLNAGVLEEGAVTHPDAGTPQGGVISPLLANIYLHEVLDVWFERVVKPRLRGRAFLCRYADDFVVLFQYREDARRVQDVLPKRLGRYGLAIHPGKTRLLKFRRPAKYKRQASEIRLTANHASFDFLGFTHHWSRSRENNWVVKLRTAKSRMSRALSRVRAWCRDHRHHEVSWQWEMLVAKLRGHYGYFGVTGNLHALERFRFEVVRTWRRWLSRRSSRTRHGWGPQWAQLLERYPLPAPTIRRAFSTS